MTSLERLLNRLRSQPVDRPPNLNIMMTYAAHYIGQPLSRYYLDHDVLCRANLAVQQAFALDIVQAISDPYREASDLGLPVEFPVNDLPVRKQALILELADIEGVKMPAGGAGPRMSDRLAAVAQFRRDVGGDVPIMGWVEGALAEAADLRGVTELLLDMSDSPEWVTDLLERCAEVAVSFARAQVAAGADIIGLGDAIASQISPRAYRAFALPYEQHVFRAVHELGALARLHICGDTTHILPDMMETGADIIDLDWMVDMAGAAAVAGPDGPALCGNQDPVAIMLQGTPEDVAQAVAACIRQGGPRSMSGAGCEIAAGTPAANLHAQSRILREIR